MKEKFSNRLKELRIEKGITQKELAKQIDTTNSAISYWEKAINEPKINYVIALSEYFNVSTDYLLGLSDEY